MVTTTESVSPSSERIGVTLKSARTHRPSLTESSTSSARSVLAPPSKSTSGISDIFTSLPSAKRQVSDLIASSGERSGSKHVPHDAPSLAVERRTSRPRVEDCHAHRARSQ